MLRYVPPTMNHDEYLQLPQIVRDFVTWQDAQQGKVIELPDDKQLQKAVEYFTKGDPNQ